MIGFRGPRIASRSWALKAVQSSSRARLASGIASEAQPQPVPSLPTSPSTKYINPEYTFADPSSSSSSSETAKTLSLADQYILPVYARPSFVLSHGKGSWLWDKEGRKFLDFSAGIAVNALGHADPEYLDVLENQASKLIHTSNVYHNEWAPKLAELLVTLTQKEGGLGFATGVTSPSSHSVPSDVTWAKVFFANSGTEANEGALKIARKVGKDRWAATQGDNVDLSTCSKTGIVCFENSFHGRSMGALSVTSNPKYQAPFTPLIPGVVVGKLNDYATIDSLVNEDTCAVIVEPIQGEGGIHPAEERWLGALRKRCNAVGAVLIFDEIQCGLYRSGTLWAHSSLPVECHPDMITMAKPLANGFPIGAVLLRDSIASTMTAGTHGTTFGGSPLACALGFHVLSHISARPFVSHLAEASAYLSGRLELLPKWFPDILLPQVRGRGFIMGLGFKNTNHPGDVVNLARERGLFVLTAGKDALRLVPSLNVEKEEIDFAVDVIEGCLSNLKVQ